MAQRGPGAPGQRSPSAPGRPPAFFPACAKGRAVPIPPASAVTWPSAPRSLGRPGAHSPGPGSRRQEAVEAGGGGGGGRSCDGGGGGAGGLGAPAGWEDGTQSVCWAKEGSWMEGLTLGREGKGALLRLFVGLFKSSWGCGCS